ncbi:hypothetical protein DSO57_1005362 [Entomophthora muscae]|uniref:Uncharacterized protein n=1 Tax=Entomophthora muscae TaxID=34485 RepID=A0ACC2RMS9_9FUNG|nr:hypothetical protein DSO57_1005362 [Entomophthora muscae]
MSMQQSRDAVGIPITVGLGGVVEEMKLPPSTVWTGNQGEFGSKHILNPAMLTAWPRSCFKKTVYVTKHTFCFTAHHVGFYWRKPIVVSRSVQCPPNKLCNISPSLPITIKAHMSKLSDMHIVKLLANQTKVSFALNPVNGFKGIMKSKPLSFAGPGHKHLCATLLHINITGEYEEFYGHYSNGKRLYYLQQFTFPLALNSKTLDAAMSLADVDIPSE